jgi:hypothetical protein
LFVLDTKEPSWEPLNLIAKCDPVSVALYGETNGLLDKKGWRYLKRHARNVRKIYRYVREIAKAKASDGPKYKMAFDYLIKASHVPRLTRRVLKGEVVCSHLVVLVWLFKTTSF